MNKKGFTLIELLIVVAIIAILAVVVFVALNPLKRFQDSRDSVRWQQASEILNAVKLDQVDHGGLYLSAIANLATNTVYMIGTDATGCNGFNDNCTTVVTGSSSCVDLAELTTQARGGYLSSIPVGPNGNGSWTAGHTGYTMQLNTNGSVAVRSCENENSPEIVLSR